MSDKPMKDSRLAREIDKEDIKYIASLAAKKLEKHDGKTPKHQLDSEDYKRFSGINMQSQGKLEPFPEEATLALYLIDAKQEVAKRFTVTAALIALMSRNTNKVGYGTTSLDGRQFKVIVQWEKEIRQ
jgi:hypothetical protein